MGDPERRRHEKIPGWPDRAIAQIAGDQRTLVTTGQLLGLGVGHRAIARAVARGRLHRVHHGVHSLVPPKARPPLAAEQAALLACGPRAVLSHTTAAQLWGLLAVGPGDPIHVTRPVRSPYRGRAGITVHEAPRLHRRDVRRHERLLVTSPARAILECAPSLSDRRLELAVDEALKRRITSRTAIEDTLDRAPTTPGAPRLRMLIDAEALHSVTESPPEEELLQLIRRAGLPAPETQAEVGPYRLDFLWRTEKVVVEYDSFGFHSGRTSFESDRRRDNELRTLGYVVIRITERQLGDEPERVIAWIATALARR